MAVTRERRCASVSASRLTWTARLTAALLLLLVSTAKSASATSSEDVDGSGGDQASLTYRLTSVGGQQLYTAVCSSDETKDERSIDRSSNLMAIELIYNSSDKSPLASAGSGTEGKAAVFEMAREATLAARGYLHSTTDAALLVVGFYDDHVLDPKLLSCQLKFTDTDTKFKVQFRKLPARRMILTVEAAALKIAARRSGGGTQDPDLQRSQVVLELSNPEDRKLLPTISTRQARENVLLFLEQEPAPTTAAGRKLAKAEDVTMYTWRRLSDGSIRLTLYAPEKSAVAFAAENDSLIVKACFSGETGETCFRLRSSSPSGAADSESLPSWVFQVGVIAPVVLIVVIFVVVVVVVVCVRRHRARRLSRSASAGRGLNPDQANELNTYSEQQQRAAKAKGSFAYGEEEAQGLCKLRTEADFVDLKDSREAEKELPVEPPDPLLPKSTAVEDSNDHDSAFSVLVI